MKRLAICVVGSLIFALAGCDDMRSQAELPATEQVLTSSTPKRRFCVFDEVASI